MKIPQTPGIDFGEIKGQYLAKRVLEIAAAGSHHTMLIGPTGTGKTMFIKAFPSILPDNIKSLPNHCRLERQRSNPTRPCAGSIAVCQ